MKKIMVFTFLLFGFLLSGCAVIPQQSVSLSNEVGIGIKKQHQSQIDLINIYIEAKRKELDQALQNSLQTYFKTITPTGTITLNREQLDDIAKDVLAKNEKNNKAKEELEQVRVFLITKLEDNYLTLSQANANITGLLQSAVTVNDAKTQADNALSKVTNGKIELGNVFAEIDKFVINKGEEAGKATNLINKIQDSLNQSKNK